MSTLENSKNQTKTARKLNHIMRKLQSSTSCSERKPKRSHFSIKEVIWVKNFHAFLQKNQRT